MLDLRYLKHGPVTANSSNRTGGSGPGLPFGHDLCLGSRPTEKSNLLIVNVVRLTMLRIDPELTQSLQLVDSHSLTCVGIADLILKRTNADAVLA